MQDPTPETPLTADDLGKIADEGLDDIVAGNKARRAGLFASLARRAGSLASSPDYKRPRWWLGVASVVVAVAIQVAGAVGAPPADVALAQQVAQGVEQTAGAVIDRTEDGELSPEDAASIALFAGPLALGLANLRKRKP